MGLYVPPPAAPLQLKVTVVLGETLAEETVTEVGAVALEKLYRTGASTKEPVECSPTARTL